MRPTWRLAALGGSCPWTALERASAATEPIYIAAGSYWNLTPGTRRVDAFQDPPARGCYSCATQRRAGIDTIIVTEISTITATKSITVESPTPRAWLISPLPWAVIDRFRRLDRVGPPRVRRYDRLLRR